VSESAPLLGAALAVVAAAGYSASDLTTAVVVRRGTAPVAPALVAYWAHLVATVLLVGAAALAAAPPPVAEAGLALGAGFVAGAGVVVYYAALARGAASILAPLAAAGLILPVLVGVARGERTVLLAVAGTAVLLAGVALLAGSGREDGARADARALVLAGLGALCFGGYFVFVDLAVGDGTDAHPLWVAGLVTTGTALAATPIVLATAGRRALLVPPACGWFAVAAVGVLLTVADLALTVAMTQGDVALVSVVASADPALSVLAARFVLAERISRRQAAGVAVALAGLLAVAAA